MRLISIGKSCGVHEEKKGGRSNVFLPDPYELIDRGGCPLFAIRLWKFNCDSILYETRGARFGKVQEEDSEKRCRDPTSWVEPPAGEVTHEMRVILGGRMRETRAAHRAARACEVRGAARSKDLNNIVCPGRMRSASRRILPSSRTRLA